MNAVRNRTALRSTTDLRTSWPALNWGPFEPGLGQRLLEYRVGNLGQAAAESLSSAGSTVRERVSAGVGPRRWPRKGLSSR